LIAAASNDRVRGLRARLVGDLYLTTQQPPQAEKWYQTAVDHDPAQFPAQVRALALNNRLAEAIRLCRENQQRDATSQPAIMLAFVLIEIKSHGEYDAIADAFLRSALERHSKDAKLLYAIATLRAVQSRYDEAIGLYRAVLELEPRNIPALNNLAMLLAESPDRRTEALTLIDRAIDIAGQQPGLLDTKGAILVYQGQAQQALILLEAAAREAGQDARHRFHLAAAYRGVGNLTLARQQLQAAIDQNLEKEVLTPTDLRIFTDLKAALIPN
jgi:tetratricopeptide (TPR) repeat protein